MDNIPMGAKTTPKTSTMVPVLTMLLALGAVGGMFFWIFSSPPTKVSVTKPGKNAVTRGAYKISAKISGKSSTVKKCKIVVNDVTIATVDVYKKTCSTTLDTTKMVDTTFNGIVAIALDEAGVPIVQSPDRQFTTRNTPTPLGTFTLSSDPENKTIFAGETAMYSIGVTSDGSFQGAVSLKASGMPAGVQALFTQPWLSVKKGQSAYTFLILPTTTNTTALGYQITVTGTNTFAGRTKTVKKTIMLTVNAKATTNPALLMRVTPATQTVEAPNTAMYDVVLQSQDGFTGTVKLSATPPPTRVFPAFADTSLVVPANGTATTIMRVATSLTTTPDAYTIAVQAATDTKTVSQNVSLTVTAPPITVIHPIVIVEPKNTASVVGTVNFSAQTIGAFQYRFYAYDYQPQHSPQRIEEKFCENTVDVCTVPLDTTKFINGRVALWVEAWGMNTVGANVLVGRSEDILVSIDNPIPVVYKLLITAPVENASLDMTTDIFVDTRGLYTAPNSYNGALIRFYVDDMFIGEKGCAVNAIGIECAWKWDTIKNANGTHIIRAMAYSYDGYPIAGGSLLGYSAPRTVTVTNRYVTP